MQKFYGIWLLAASLLCAFTEEDPSSALLRLMDGNARYSENVSDVPEDFEEKRSELITTQSPFAIIVGCSDSRVPPEIIFNQSLGDLFVVRVAGNVVGDLEMDSIAYAIDQLHVPLIFVLGHESCGAVTAVLEGRSQEQEISHIAPLIQRAIDASEKLPGDRLKNAIITNVRFTVQHLEKKPLLQKLIAEQRIKIAGGYYCLETGIVQHLP